MKQGCSKTLPWGWTLMNTALWELPNNVTCVCAWLDTLRVTRQKLDLSLIASSWEFVLRMNNVSWVFSKFIAVSFQLSTFGLERQRTPLCPVGNILHMPQTINNVLSSMSEVRFLTVPNQCVRASCQFEWTIVQYLLCSQPCRVTFCNCGASIDWMGFSRPVVGISC